VECSK